MKKPAAAIERMNKKLQETLSHFRANEIVVETLTLSDEEEITNSLINFIKNNPHCVFRTKLRADFGDSYSEFYGFDIQACRMETEQELAARKQNYVENVMRQERARRQETNERKKQREARELAEFERLKKKFNK